MADQIKLQEFPWERIAMAGGEMPDKLPYSEQLLFLSLRLLYNSYKQKLIDREMATKEKSKLITEYQINVLMDKISLDLVAQLKRSELARAEYRKNRTLENADKVIDTLEGKRI
jgi:hypothetical protein